MRVFALDVGSSSVRAGAYDEQGREIGEPARRAYEARHGHDGSVELDPDRLVNACEAVLAEAGAGEEASGISYFWHSLLLLDKRDRPLRCGELPFGSQMLPLLPVDKPARPTRTGTSLISPDARPSR